MKLKLYSLFISYRFGGHYCGVYTSLETTHQVIKEMARDVEIDEDIPNMATIKEHLIKNNDFFHKFNDSTWIHVQEVSPFLVEKIVNLAGGGK